MDSIPGFPNYQITEDGKIWSNRRKRFLKPSVDRYGYERVVLSENGKSYYRTIHRLVAITYLPNPANLPCVNHINEDKLDNRWENLEWCTVAYNDNYGTRNSRMSASKCHKPVIAIGKNGVCVEFSGVKEASRITGIAHSQISRCCKGSIPHTHGIVWRYK